MKPYVSSALPVTTAADPAGDYLGIGSYGGGGDQIPYGPGIYGFNWWFNATGGLHPTSKTWPDAPDDTFQANGHWSREAVTVIPSLKVVMAYFGGATLGFTPGSSASSSNQVLKLLADSVTPTVPLIAINKNQLSRTVDFCSNAPSDTFTVANGGVGTLIYSVSSDQAWIDIDPANGTSTGETDTITVSYQAASLPVGVHTATITVADNGSTPAVGNGPQTIGVTLTVKTVLPDLDLDGDVDQEDFGGLQRCLSTVGVSDPPSCSIADINDDGIIDQADIQMLIDCFSSPGSLAEPTCDDAFED
jgi:hypothetical protein